MHATVRGYFDHAVTTVTASMYDAIAASSAPRRSFGELQIEFDIVVAILLSERDLQLRGVLIGANPTPRRAVTDELRQAEDE